METPITFDRMNIPHELYPLLKLKSEASGYVKYLPLVFVDSLSAKREEYSPVEGEKTQPDRRVHAPVRGEDPLDLHDWRLHGAVEAVSASRNRTWKTSWPFSPRRTFTF